MVRFEDEPGRVAALDRWRVQHDAWAIAERPARAAFALYQRVYQLHGDLARESGRSELVLGDAVLVCDGASGQMRHPILTQRLSLEFDSDVPELVFRQTDDPPELYAALLNEIATAHPERVSNAREELAKNSYHPLGADAGPFLQRLAHDLSPTGAYAEAGEAHNPDAQLLIIQRHTFC